MTNQSDPGQHYRCKKRITLTKTDIENGFVEADYSPYAIALAWGMTDHMEFFILKKDLRMGRSLKDKRQEMLDIINAANERIKFLDAELLTEANQLVTKIESTITEMVEDIKVNHPKPVLNWIKNTGI